MKKEYISRALADTYYHAAVDGRDMRRVADQLETLRASIEEKSLYQAWRDVDKAVGQVLQQENEELFEILNSFRKSFVAWAFEVVRVEVRDAFREDAEKGWEAFLKNFVESLVHWRFQVYTEIHKEVDVDQVPEGGLALYLNIAEKTPFMLEGRWGQVYDLLLELAALPFVPESQRIELLCSAGQIQLYFFSDGAHAAQLFDQAKEIDKEDKHSRVAQSMGEKCLLDWEFDEARNYFEQASMRDPQNEFALLYMGDSYREEGRFSIAEAWYGDARTLHPGSTDVFSRYIRLFEKREYFQENDPQKIRPWVDTIARLVPEEEFSALIDGGYAFQCNDHFDEAEKWYREAISKEPERGGGWINLGYILEKKELYAKSEKAFLKEPEPEPNYFDALWGLAFLYERMKDKEEAAIQMLEKCRQLRPEWEVYVIPRIADLQRKTGQVAAANEGLLDSLKRFPKKDAEPLRLLHEQVNELPEEEALALLEQILKVKGKGYSDNFSNRTGNVKYRFGKYEEASNYYRKAIKVDPHAPIYHYNLGLAQDHLGLFDEAEAAFQEYLQLDTPTPDNLNTIGVFFYNKRQEYQKALDFYLEAIKGNSENANYYYNEALAREKLEQYEEAEAAYLRAIECNSDDPENFNGLGVFYFNRKRNELAIENYQKAIAINPEEGLYFSNLGLAHQRLGNEQEELEAYQQAAQLNPRYHLEVGRVYYGRGQFKEATQAFALADDLIDQYPINLAYYGLSLENTGQKVEAESTYLRALGKEPTMDDYFYNRLGILCYQQGRHQEALIHYQEAIKRANAAAVYYENLGLVYEALGNESEAISNYSTAMDLEPENGQYPNRIGVYYYSQKRHEKAIEFYEKALKLNPENAVYNNNMALALEAFGKYGEAEKAFLNAIDLDPSNATYPNFLGGMYFRAQQYSLAATYFEKAVALDTSIAFYFENLGLAYENLGKLAEAEDAFTQAIAAEPDSPVYQNRLGLFYFNQGRYAESIPYYEKALEKQPDNVIFLTNLGLAYLNLKDGNTAATYFEKALSYKPGDKTLENYLALAKG